jgi:L-threonylcarbamoyladenylate synthase
VCISRKSGLVVSDAGAGAQYSKGEDFVTKSMTAVVPGREGIEEAVRVLRAGGMVALPTETVYGLGARAMDPVACAAVFEAKGRPLSDPLIVHLPSIEWLGRVAEPSELDRELAAAYWPGPLTLVLPKRDCVPDIVTAGQASVAVRVSAHPVFREVAGLLGGPIAAPSANRFGRISPTRPEHVAEELGGRIPLILDGGPCQHGIESTIVRVAGGRIEILRRGPVTGEELAAFAPLAGAGGGGVVPGSLKSHYAPRTPLLLVEAGDPPEARGGRRGLLAWSQPRAGFEAVRVLSASGDPRVAAANFYAALRSLDAAGLDVIHAEQPPPGGLGDAIRERLEKAAAAAGRDNLPQTG